MGQWAPSGCGEGSRARLAPTQPGGGKGPQPSPAEKGGAGGERGREEEKKEGSVARPQNLLFSLVDVDNFLELK